MYERERDDNRGGRSPQKRVNWLGWIIGVLVGIVVLFGIMFMTCTSTVDPGFEGVLTQKPLFGDGGVVEEPVRPGRVWKSWLTSIDHVDVRPKKFDETFDDVVSWDNIPVDFTAYVSVRPKDGKSPAMVMGFGLDVKYVYENNLMEPFRTQIRRMAQKFTMTELTAGRYDGDIMVNDKVVRSLPEEFVPRKGEAPMDTIARLCDQWVSRFLEEEGIPLEVDPIQISKAVPNGPVLEALSETGAQQQRRKTENERAAAELARKVAEENRALADKAYMDKMGTTMSQYVQLEQIRAYLRGIEMIKGQTGVTVILSPSFLPDVTVPVGDRGADGKSQPPPAAK